VLRIGIAFSLKPDDRGNGPDDRFEEFDKPETIEAIAEAIRADGHDVSLIGDGRDFLTRMLADPPHFVFNIAEGQGANRDREARVPSVCAMLGVPYSGSDPFTLCATLDKDVARVLVSSRGGLCPDGFVLAPGAHLGDVEYRASLLLDDSASGRVILKPNLEGSSKGIRGDCLASSVEDAVTLFQRLARDYAQPVLMEDFIDGDEVTVGVIGNGDEAEVLGIMRIAPKSAEGPFVYSLDVKRDWQRRVSYETPAALSPGAIETLSEAALLAYAALACRDVARIDFRIHDDSPHFLEANPLPGLAPVTSDLVILAEGYGVSHGELVRKILRAALARVGLAGS